MDRPTAERATTLLREDLDWSYLLGTAQCHVVASLLYRSVRQIAPERVPASVLVELQREYHRLGFLIHLQIAQLLELLHLLQRHDVTAIPFKGPVLGAYAYGDPTRRKPGDVDLLIRNEDYATVRDLLVSQGYKQETGSFQEARYIERRGGSKFTHRSGAKYDVDLHWTLEQLPFDSFPYSLKLDTGQVWARSQALTLNGTTLRALSGEDMLLHLCANGAKDTWGLLIQVCDVAELIRRRPLDWPQVAQRAGEMRGERILHLGLLLARDLLGAALPEQVRRDVEGGSVAKALALQVSAQLFDPYSAARKKVGRSFSEALSHHLFRTKLLERPQDKMLYIVYRGMRKLSKSRMVNEKHDA